MAKEDDIDQVHDWVKAFSAETIPGEPVPSREHIASRIAAGRIWLWTTNDEAVSMSAIGRTLDRGSAISLVYSPPEHRNLGYAGGATTAVARAAFKAGAQFIYLYVDDSNPASNRCYTKIGFQPYCKSNMYIRAKDMD